MYLLVDADMVLFRNMTRSLFDLEVEPDIWICQADLGVARERFWDDIADLAERAGAAMENVVLCWTDHSTFRRELMGEYKGTRKRKPPGYKALRTELLGHNTSTLHDQIEADDLISILGHGLPTSMYTVASGDKDLNQVPGLHVWIDKDEPWLISHEESERFTWHQALTGDPTDGYPGCPGLGPKGAEKVLADVDCTNDQEAWAAVLAAFEAKGLRPEQALLQVRLARLLRPGEYDQHTRHVFPWTPA